MFSTKYGLCLASLAFTILDISVLALILLKLAWPNFLLFKCKRSFLFVKVVSLIVHNLVASDETGYALLQKTSKIGIVWRNQNGIVRFAHRIFSKMRF